VQNHTAWIDRPLRGLGITPCCIGCRRLRCRRGYL